MRKRPSQGRSRSTVTSILEAADRILRADGYEAASTNRVARVAGFSVGSLYQYFRDKQSIVGALIDRTLASEAAALAQLLDQSARRSSAEIVRDAFALLAERRLASAHLYRALDAYPLELGIETALNHIVASQAPALSDTVQRIGARVMPRSQRSVDARTFVLSRVVSMASFALAVDAPQGLAPDALREELARAVDVFLSEAPPGPAALEHTLSWAKGNGHAASPSEQRARRRREARGILLAANVEAPQLEPRVFLLAGLAEIASATKSPPRGSAQDELLHEVARFATALGG